MDEFGEVGQWMNAKKLDNKKESENGWTKEVGNAWFRGNWWYGEWGTINELMEVGQSKLVIGWNALKIVPTFEKSKIV